MISEKRNLQIYDTFWLLRYARSSIFDQFHFSAWFKFYLKFKINHNCISGSTTSKIVQSAITRRGSYSQLLPSLSAIAILKSLYPPPAVLQQRATLYSDPREINRAGCFLFNYSPARAHAGNYLDVIHFIINNVYLSRLNGAYIMDSFAREQRVDYFHQQININFSNRVYFFYALFDLFIF